MLGHQVCAFLRFKVMIPSLFPLTVVTGFLGAGKTTLLNSWLARPSMHGTAVLINEFGAIGLDDQLLANVAPDNVLLRAGCVCCTVRHELIHALEHIVRDHDNNRRVIERVVLETTGLADPLPILQTVAQHPYLRQRFSVDSVVTVIDAVNGLAILESHKEARHQVLTADRLVIRKKDHADFSEEAFKALCERLQHDAPHAQWIDVLDFNEAVALLDTPYESQKIDFPGFSHDHHHHNYVDVNLHSTSIRAMALSSKTPLRDGTADIFCDLLRSKYGANLLRLKGIVFEQSEPHLPIVLQAVQNSRFPSLRQSLRSMHSESHVVVISQHLPEEEARATWQACLA
jgi:G3E family GTPase